MAFVLVVAGANRGVHGTQFEREPGIALEIHASRIPIERYESEHSAGYLEHGDTISEGIVLKRSGKTSAQFEDLLSRHVRVLFVSLAAGPGTSAARKRLPIVPCRHATGQQYGHDSRFPHHVESIYLMHRRPRYLRQLNRRKVLGQWILRLYR